jgi:uncharacterized RDD family membrane protein YckC
MQTCHECGRDVGPDMFFCAWCKAYLGANGRGTKANLFPRWVALILDPLIGICAWLIPSVLLGSISRSLGIGFALLFPLAYAIWALTLFRQGMTPGKFITGLQVVDQRTGDIPGFWKMLLRETFGRILSGLFLGIGMFWAVFDKNGQAWHDFLAGTVVIKRASGVTIPIRARV